MLAGRTVIERIMWRFGWCRVDLLHDQWTCMNYLFDELESKMKYKDALIETQRAYAESADAMIEMLQDGNDTDGPMVIH